MANDQALPAWCKQHGIIPLMGLVSLSGGGMLHVGDNVLGNCPICGDDAIVLPGAYSAVKDGIQYISDGQLPAGVLAAIMAITRDVQAGSISLAEAKSKADEISPKVGKLFDIGDWPAGAKATLFAAIIGAAAVVYNTATSKPSSTIHNINVHNVIERPAARRDDLLSGTSLSMPDIPLPRPRPKPGT